MNGINEEAKKPRNKNGNFMKKAKPLSLFFFDERRETWKYGLVSWVCNILSAQKEG